MRPSEMPSDRLLRFDEYNGQLASTMSYCMSHVSLFPHFSQLFQKFIYILNYINHLKRMVMGYRTPISSCCLGIRRYALLSLALFVGLLGHA